MPEGLLNRLSVRQHEMIGGVQRSWVWNDGVVFRDKGVVAELRELRQPDTNRINIRIKGKDAHWMSETLIREINKINEAFNLERLKVAINIPCICSVCKKSKAPFYLEFEQVKSDLQKEDPKFHTYQCLKSRETIDFHQLLKTISHKALREVAAVQKKQKIGKYGGGKVTFEGEGGVDAFTKMMDKNPAEIKAHMSKESNRTRKSVQTAAEATRATVQQEAQTTRATVQKMMDEMPDIFKDNLRKSEERLLRELFGKLETLELDINNTQDLIEIVGRGVDEVFFKQPSQEELLKAFQEMTVLKQDADKVDLKHKLKISLWLIPTILKYESELSGGILKDLKARWKRGGLKGLFLE